LHGVVHIIVILFIVTWLSEVKLRDLAGPNVTRNNTKLGITADRRYMLPPGLLELNNVLACPAWAGLL
jgi:hypothetical protein